MFHGWRIVGVAAFAQAISIGATFYAYGAFLKPLAREFEVSRLAITLGLTLMTLVQGAIAPFLGRALDRGSARGIMITGVLVASSGFLLLSQATAFWQIGLIFVTAVSIGAALFGPLATATVVASWFIRSRGRALGIAAIGAAVGGGIFPPLSTAMIDGLGWRGALAALGVGLLLLIPALAWMMIRHPEDIGETPDGIPVDPASGREPSVGEYAPVTTGDLVRQRNFWVITIGVGFAFCPVSVLLAHLVPYATDIGISPARASIVMSGYALASGIGRVVFGILADRIDKRVACWITFGWLGLAWTNLLGEPAFPKLLAAAVGSGVAMGGIMPLWGALAGAAFGRAAFGQAMGLMNFLMLPFSVVGAPTAAYLFDRTGSYQLAFSSFLVFFLLAAITIAFLRLPTVEPGVQTTEALAGARG